MLGCMPRSGDATQTLLLEHPSRGAAARPPSLLCCHSTHPAAAQNTAPAEAVAGRCVRNTHPSLALSPASANYWLDDLGQMTKHLWSRFHLL